MVVRPLGLGFLFVWGSSMMLRHWFAGLVTIAWLAFPLAASAQLEEVEDVIETVQRVIRPRPATPPPVAPGVAPGEEGPEKPAAEEKEEPDVPRKPRAPLPPRYILLKLLDGSTIAGD